MAKYLTDQELCKAALGKLWVCCDHLHHDTCFKYWLKCFSHSLIFALKFYVPLSIASLLFKISASIKNPVISLKNALTASVRSALTLSAMVLFAKITICTYLKIFHKGDSLIMIFAALLATPATFIESQNKVSEFALYVMPRFFDAFWKFLKRRNICVNVPYFQVILFCASISCITFSAFSDPKSIKPIHRKICEKFFGIN